MFETLPFSVRQTFRGLTPGFCHPEPDSGSRRFSFFFFLILFNSLFFPFPLLPPSPPLLSLLSVLFLTLFLLLFRLPLLLPLSLFSSPSSFSLPCSLYFLLSFFFPLRSLSSLSSIARGMTDWECGAYRRDDGWRERE